MVTRRIPKDGIIMSLAVRLLVTAVLVAISAADTCEDRVTNLTRTLSDRDSELEALRTGAGTQTVATLETNLLYSKPYVRTRCARSRMCDCWAERGQKDVFLQGDGDRKLGYQLTGRFL